MRLSSILFSAFFAAFCGAAQQARAQINPIAVYANMSIMDINLHGGGNDINGAGVLIFNIGNESPSSTTGIIPVGTINAHVSFPLEYGIAGPYGGHVPPAGLIDSLDEQGWQIEYLETGFAGTIKVINTQQIGSGEYLPLRIPVVGLAEGSGIVTITLDRNVPVTINNLETVDDVLNNTFTVLSVPVPITLSKFSANESNCGTVAVEWTTEQEAQFSHFGVEYSKDAKSFHPVALVKSKGEATGSAYKLSLHQADKVGFYRLKMVDIDNSFSYSDVRKVSLSCLTEQILLSPNPAQSTATLSNLQLGDLVQLIGLNGALINEATAEAASYTLNLSELATGVYTVMVKRGNVSMATIKLVKQ